MLKNINFKVANLEADAETGIIEAIVSVFGSKDRVNDIVRPGFFSKSLLRKMPKGVWMHDWKQPVAKTIEARELLPGDPKLPPDLADSGGLYIKGQFNLETTRGKEAFSDIKFGLVDEFSFGYNTLKEKKDAKTGINELLEGEIYEWSPVLVGAHKQTALLSVKGEAGEDADAEEEDEREERKSLLAGLTFENHFEEVLATVIGFKQRAVSLKTLREKQSRRFSETNRIKLRKLIAELNEVAGVAEEEPKTEEEVSQEETAAEVEAGKAFNHEVSLEFARFVKFQADSMLAKIKK